MTPDLIKEREERYEKRKKAKRDFDKVINLSVKKGDQKSFMLSVKQSDTTVRLLDEGVVVDADGDPMFYIKKGALQAFYDRLDDDYVGSINIGHQEFASFPFLVGEWTKKDLSLVDIGDGRKGLDVSLKLDDNSIFVKELRRNDYTVGVSAEFFYEVDYENSDILRLEVLSRVDIKDFGIVGEAGNAASGGIKLKGETGMKNDGILAKLAAKYLKAEEKEESKAKTEEKKEEVKTEGEVEAKAETELDIAGAVEEIGELLEEKEEMLSLMETMDAELEAVKAELADAKKELAAKGTTVDETIGKFKELAAKYGSKQKEKKAAVEEKKNDTLSDDGLGVL